MNNWEKLSRARGRAGARGQFLKGQMYKVFTKIYVNSELQSVTATGVIYAPDQHGDFYIVAQNSPRIRGAAPRARRGARGLFSIHHNGKNAQEPMCRTSMRKNTGKQDDKHQRKCPAVRHKRAKRSGRTPGDPEALERETRLSARSHRQTNEAAEQKNMQGLPKQWKTSLAPTPTHPHAISAQGPPEKMRQRRARGPLRFSVT